MVKSEFKTWTVDCGMDGSVSWAEVRFGDGTVALAARDNVFMGTDHGVIHAIGLLPDGGLVAGTTDYGVRMCFETVAKALLGQDGFKEAVEAFGLTGRGKGLYARTSAGAGAAKSFLGPETSHAKAARILSPTSGYDGETFRTLAANPAIAAVSKHVAEWPFLCAFVGKDKAFDDAVATGSPDLVCAGIGRVFGIPVTKALMRRLRGIDLDVRDVVGLVADVAAMTFGKWPSSQEEWKAACRVGEAQDWIGPVAGRRVPPLRDGLDWAGAVARLTALTGRDDGRVPVSMFADVCKAFRDEVLLPALSREAGEEFNAVTCAAGVSAAALVRAREVLAAGRSVVDVYEADDLWHRTFDVVEQQLPPPKFLDAVKWEVPCREFKVKGTRIVVVPLGDAAALRAEGDRKTGMRSCVGSKLHVRKAAAGKSSVFSVRRRPSVGEELRLSTFEVEPFGTDGGFRLVQHRGAGNGDPPNAARAAYWDWLEAIRKNKLAYVNPKPKAAPDLGYDWSVDGNVEKALEAWRRILPKAYRTASVEDVLGEELMAGFKSDAVLNAPTP